MQQLAFYRLKVETAVTVNEATVEQITKRSIKTRYASSCGIDAYIVNKNEYMCHIISAHVGRPLSFRGFASSRACGLSSCVH